jgi:murein DD-endopeptidase MepM/ murein hydrolase activator NlpD
MLSELSKRVNYNIEAAQVSVSGQVLAVVKDVQTAQDVLNEIAKKYTAEGAKIIKTEFVPNVDITPLYVSKDQLTEPSSLQAMLTKTTNTPKSYTVSAGDTLYGIASKAELTLAQLLEANPGITENTPLQIGQTLNLVVAVPLVSVRTTQEITETQVIEYGTQIVENNDEYKTYSKTISAGENGEKTVVSNIISLNGLEESRSVVSENVTKQAVDEKVEVGTLETPPKRAMGSFNYPASATLTSGFGARWGRQHAGIDLGASYGTPVYASDGGTVTFAGYNSGGYGYLVIIDHNNGYETYYGHNSSLAVSEGQQVAQGELIAYVGSTGDSTGNHVHFEIRKNGVPENPLNYLNN